ncbi:MAG: ADP-forming succinate--CoA ligase subunit beta [Candidatus Acetothermia bacterium]|nr:ADP-forming succinate--CoA ligase subunit beta [Candidatus Acetothermia bacterium]MDH7505919.1 ADP-forming succinate--CoA ligase subunit beta [Candidatus Acetothermia bacterium]
MKLQEYQGKELFKRVGIAVNEGRVATSPEEAEAIARALGFPVVIKAQVLVGGRGKAGGVKLAASPEETRAQAARILGMVIKGERVEKLLVARAAEIAQEFYLGITLDRAKRMPVMIFSPAGGMEIEEVAKARPEAIFRFHVHPLEGPHPYQIRNLLLRAGIDKGLQSQFASLFNKLYQAFTQYQANLVEINPLALTPAGELVAVDAKFIIDDDALPRLGELASWRDAGSESPQERAAREAGLNYVKLDGNIGIIGNGAGLVMATLDLVAALGGKPANFLDIGGGARAAQIEKALEIVLSDPQVEGLFLNIFGGITRCDEVARGLVEAWKKLQAKLPLVVRLTGTNEEEGRAILEAQGISPVREMEEGARRIVELVR